MDQLTADDVRAIRAAVTWGDQHWAKAKAKADDDDDRTALTMHRAAIRLELVPKDSTLQTFLDAIPLDVMGEAFGSEEERDPTSPSTGT